MIPNLAGRSVLVTGGAGFIGSHLVDALVARGAQVRVIDNLATGRRRNLAGCSDQIELIEDDLCDPSACARACEGVELVFHQAALGSVPRSLADPAATVAVNVSGFANLLTASRDHGVRRVVYASSSSVYGDSEALPKREGEEGAPLSPYAASKQMCEALARVFTRCFELEVVGLRYFNVYGPRQRPDGPYAAAIPRFFEACREQRPALIYGDGEQSRDFTFVGDAVRANLLAAGASAAVGGVYNVAAGRAASLNQLVKLIRELTGDGPPPLHQAARPGDVRHSLADLTRSRRDLGYAPRHDLEGGLATLRDALD